MALESTIIAHGMPYPENLETALAVEGTSATAFPKASVRDLPVLYARGLNGATTVAATAAIAAQAAIRVLVTGGIGGVHRGWEGSLDVSADLEVRSSTSARP